MTCTWPAILSANLALVNILPFPPLDGGRMLVIVLKAIPRFGQKISLRAEQLTYAVGFVALFTFLIWITVFDIAKQVGGTRDVDRTSSGPSAGRPCRSTSAGCSSAPRTRSSSSR